MLCDRELRIQFAMAFDIPRVQRQRDQHRPAKKRKDPPDWVTPSYSRCIKFGWQFLRFGTLQAFVTMDEPSADRQYAEGTPKADQANDDERDNRVEDFDAITVR